MRGAIIPLPNTLSLRGSQLKIHMDNFTFYIYRHNDKCHSVFSQFNLIYIFSLIIILPSALRSSP